MYNIDMYTYQKDPFTITKKVGIHPLDDPGLVTYVGKESHNYNYLKRTNPKVFKHILLKDYETVIKEQNELLELKRKGKHRRAKTEEFKQTFNENIQPQFEETKIPESQTIPHAEEEMPQEEQPITNEKEGNDFNKTYTSNFHSYQNIFNTNNQRPSKLSYHRRKNFKELYGYDNTKGLRTNREKCLKELSDLRNSKLSNDEFNYTHSKFYFPKKRYNGFTSYAVPRTINNKKTSVPFMTYEDKIKRALSCDSRRLHTAGDFETMQRENQDMKQKLLTMTNSNFCKKNQLPDIGLISNCTHKKIRNIGIGNSKEMGERYNPYGMSVKTGDYMGRNYVGALFEH
ncbi:MAG: hypothetical protein MJ252_23555 [archaeon]|nr:hypothetical protein [archaeon]